MPELSLFAEFPPEIRNQIRQYLDPTSSTALGLTCRHFYRDHRRRYGKVPLHSMVQMPGGGGGPWQISLAGLLKHWMGKPGVGLKFSTYNMLYVSKERWEELEELMWSDGWESSWLHCTSRSGVRET